MLVYFCGEDDVSKAIACSIFNYCCKKRDIIFEDVAPRAYGSKALKYLDSMVALGEQTPVVGVFDSDGGCVVSLLENNTTKGWKNNFCAINVAVDESESWLIADIYGFSAYFCIEPSALEKYIKGQEIATPYKTSLFLLQKLLPFSKNPELVTDLRIEKNNKPPLYNVYFRRFVERHWNIEAAMKNSDSLSRAVYRTKKIVERV